MVLRKQNKDFNIVYRNKPNKPKTVSELFGLKTEEPKREGKEVAKETAKEEKQPFGMASKFFQNISSSAKNAIADTLDAFRQEQQDIPASNLDKTSAIHTLVETYEKYAKNND